MSDFARELRNNATNAERRLWHHLRRRQLSGFKFRRQRPIGPYICDFVCLEAGLIVELDGGQHAERVAHDMRRDDFLRTEGFRILRFWNDDVQAEIGSVVDTIFEALNRPEMDGRLDDRLPPP
ncbi:MAG: endonuclease domain-containing protein [Reyranella sp.]|uniref:endonuclease domain-containing protein n=1 Tax=Reyranella sp. TaxID=1929291 RepID=UPI001ACFDA88|nr:DUF559 domain-containing protein [Reyranella sp.]MBN9087312.1 endonuclease domain-containing protein [Reyranella sp.]